MKVMVVDDEADVRLLFEQRFRKEIRAGLIEFYFALSAADALTFLEGHEEDVLILSDINMPGMNGLQLLKAVKQDFPAIKVAMITAYSNQYYKDAMASGADHYYTKPIDFPQLKNELFMEAVHG